MLYICFVHLEHPAHLDEDLERGFRLIIQQPFERDSTSQSGFDNRCSGLWVHDSIN